MLAVLAALAALTALTALTARHFILPGKVMLRGKVGGWCDTFRAPRHLSTDRTDSGIWIWIWTLTWIGTSTWIGTWTSWEGKNNV